MAGYPGMPADFNFFAAVRLGAKKLMAAEKAGHVPPELDFSVHAVCASCRENIYPPKKVLRCTACKSVIYCSKECSKLDWNQGTALKWYTHKQLCAGNKRQMDRLEEAHAILLQFPWGRLESDGTFNDSVARARFDVLGGSDFGFWSHRGGFVPHDNMGNMSQNDPYSKALEPLLSQFNHLEGKDLLKKEHLPDIEGWKLPAKLIPYRHFRSASKRPQLITEIDRRISDWDSWYEWRGLSKESPAALLMSFPLSAFWLITRCLELTKPSAGRPEKRVPLHIHAIGTELELNYIPLFSELALLLPYHDIKLVFFGQSVEKLVSIAKKSYPQSLAGKSSSSTPVFAYEAPKESGSGRIEVYLHPSTHWTPDVLSPSSPYGGPPDGIVAFDAGLGSYNEWIPVVQAIHLSKTPFAVTEYTEHSCEVQRANFPRMVETVGATPMREYKIDMNPFQRPGQRGVPSWRLPNIQNGFTMVVWKA